MDLPPEYAAQKQREKTEVERHAALYAAATRTDPAVKQAAVDSANAQLAEAHAAMAAADGTDPVEFAVANARFADAIEALKEALKL